MSPIIFETLSLDIYDRVLTFLQDFLSLRCAVLSSKQLYDAYSSRKRSIMRAVELNEVGPALPFAAALVRTRSMIKEEPLQVILEGLNDPNPDSAYWTINVTAAEARELAGVSAVVRRLESFFCVYYKDRTAPVSTLSDVESLRFHRAIYRAWIVSVLANDVHELSKPTGLNTNFLKNMYDEELAELHEAMQFLDVLYRSLMFRHSRFQSFFQNAARPLQLQLDEFLAHFDGHINAETFGVSLSRSGSAIVNGLVVLRTERQIVKLFREKFDSQSILINSRVEDVQACQKCNTQTHILFGENNWHLLHPTLGMEGLVNTLPGRLNGNAYVKIDLSALLERRHSFASMISEMFECQNDPESDWVRIDWLCVNCIKDFLKDRLFSWLVSELVKGMDGIVEHKHTSSTTPKSETIYASRRIVTIQTRASTNVGDAEVAAGVDVDE